MLLAPKTSQRLSLKEISVILSLAAVLFLLLLMTSCMSGQKKNSPSEQNLKVVPVFNEDSAYHYLARQLDFGPRVPNTEGHKACGDYLVEKMRSLGGILTEQPMQLVAFDGSVLRARNIIASFDPEKTRRILLFAHWDTRPWADEDPDPQNHTKAIPGANDGASGVAVLMEIARHLGTTAPASLGVDIICSMPKITGSPLFPADRGWKIPGVLVLSTGQKILTSAIIPLNSAFCWIWSVLKGLFLPKNIFLCVMQHLLSTRFGTRPQG